MSKDFFKWAEENGIDLNNKEKVIAKCFLKGTAIVVPRMSGRTFYTKNVLNYLETIKELNEE